MTQQEQVTGSEAFSSIEHMRTAHVELLESLKASAKADRQEMISSFVIRAVETGEILDLAQDRKVAQGLIDYWIASIYTDDNSQGHLTRIDETLLRPFRVEAVSEALLKGDELLNSLVPADQDLVRQILLRLVHVDTAHNLKFRAVEEEYLEKIGHKKKIKQLLGQLQEAGIIVAKQTDERRNIYELSQGGIARRWGSLSAWLDQRLRFRNAALFWEKSDQSFEALLGVHLIQVPSTYDDLSSVETRFLSRSKTRGYMTRSVIIVTGVMLVAAAYYGYKSWHWASLEKSQNTLAANIVSSRTSKEEKEWQIRSLANEDIVLLLPSATIRNLNIGGIETYGAVFVRSVLDGVLLQKSKLDGAVLSDSQIVRSDFSNSRIQFGRFDGAVISDSLFVGADLYRSIFDGALLSNVNLTDSNLRETSFRDVRLVQPDLSGLKLDGTAWWLAAGWTTDQIRTLKKLYPKEELFKSLRFRGNLEVLDHDFTKSQMHSPERINIQNARAWLFATMGFQLDSATKDINQAKADLVSLQPAPDISWYESTVENLNDTAAYIMLQQGNNEQALSILQSTNAHSRKPEFQFRYALALAANQQVEKAREQLMESLRRGYKPTHELYLLENQIPADIAADIHLAID